MKTLDKLAFVAKSIYTVTNLPYHNAYHITKMLEDAVNILNHCNTGLSDTLYAAILYHDAIYVPTRKDNEQKSAELFQLIDSNIVGDKTYNPYHVAELINLTARHTETLNFRNCKCDEFEARVIMDADLAGFAGPYDVMTTNSEKIRLENLHVDADTFVKNRIAFLNLMLQKPKIYYTAFGRQEYEDIARANIQREIEALL